MIDRLPGQLPVISGAVVHAGVIYTAGIIAPSVLTGAPTAIAEQAAEVLDLLDDVLHQAGGELASVLRVEAYLADPADMPVWNAAFTAKWPAAPPARTTVALTLAAPGALIEVQAIAAVSER
ncbi:RidA family protein [Pseudonocardia yunnanensis]|uniref:RidA family protein n=1 Tax=Pseudonocardia yunnanensis TaxID=58107 RepID=A0ABW4EVR0_9PSEU